MAAISFVLAQPLVDLFMATGTRDAVDTVSFGTDYLRIRSAEFVFVGLFQVVLGAYHGSGNTKTALAFSFLALCVGRVSTVYYLVFVTGIGPNGIWIGMSVGSIVGAVGATLWFTRGTWKESVVEE